jgi:hypothetical protein
MYAYFDNTYTRREQRPSLKAYVVRTNRPPNELKDLVESDYDISRKYHLDFAELEKGLFRFRISKQLSKGILDGQIIIDKEDSA